MKKIIILFAALYIISFQTFAEETFRYENTSWRIIKERLFGGNNSKAYRYEDEIRFQLKGEPDSQDSIVLNEIIDELNSLMEVTKANLVDSDGNFIITIFPSNSGTRVSTSQKTAQSEITLTELGFGQSTIPTIEEKREYFYYYIIRHLTKLYNPRFGSSGYGGIFDSNEMPEAVIFTEIDQDIIRKLYSEDFYKNLRKKFHKGKVIYITLI